MKKKKIYKQYQIYKNKSVSENYFTPWINIWRYEDLETNRLSSKWTESALNGPKRFIRRKTKQQNNLDELTCC